MRVLLSAFYFSPYQGSEAGLGWQVARELAQRHDVTVLCGDLSPGGFVRRDLDRMKAEQSGIDRLEIHYVPPDPLTAFLHRVHTIPGLWFVYYAAYRRWQKLACWAAQKLHAERPFQVVHHLNVIGYREPGYLWMLGPPFFWGPITGASQIPWSFIRKMGITQCWRWGSRNLLNRIQMRVSLRCRRGATKAYRVWTVSGADRDMVENLWGGHAEPMLETGTGTQRPLIPRRWESGNPLRLVWSGALHGAKALPLLLEALQRVEQGLSNASFELDILGDGPAGEDWKKIPHKLGLVTPIRWHGHVDKEEALRVMNSTHVLVHTSLKEGTPHVVLEALAMALPVLCHDACGMGLAVDMRCGKKVPLRDPETSVRGFAEALRALLSQPGLVNRLSAGAAERAEELTWQKKTRHMEEAYLAGVK